MVDVASPGGVVEHKRGTSGADSTDYGRSISRFERLRRNLRAVPDVLRAKVTLRGATKVGRTTRVWGRPRVSNRGTLIFGERVRIRSTLVPCEFVVAAGARLEIGDQTFINYAAAIAAQEAITIGPSCMIGTYCIIMDNDYHHVAVEDRYRMPDSQPIVIGDHVWIGARVTILKGVTIGAYAVVAAGSVVTRDVQPYTIVAGVPARVIRTISRPTQGELV